METKQKYVTGIVVILVIFLLLAPFADPNPDGLESVAEQNDTPEGNSFDLGFLTDYGAQGSLLYQIIKNDFLSTILSGLIGVVIVIACFLVPYYLLKERYSEKSPPEDM